MHFQLLSLFYILSLFSTVFAAPVRRGQGHCRPAKHHEPSVTTTSGWEAITTIATWTTTSATAVTTTFITSVSTTSTTASTTTTSSTTTSATTVPTYVLVVASSESSADGQYINVRDGSEFSGYEPVETTPNANNATVITRDPSDGSLHAGPQTLYVSRLYGNPPRIVALYSTVTPPSDYALLVCGAFANGEDLTCSAQSLTGTDLADFHVVADPTSSAPNQYYVAISDTQSSTGLTDYSAQLQITQIN